MSRFLTEQKKQDDFVKLVGLKRADQLQSISRNSYPSEVWNRGYKRLTADEVCRVKATRAGFSKKEIDAFMDL
jgi:hypothetical protein